MVKKKGDSKNNPIVSVTPYFFTQMVSRSSALKVVWPKDGAIVSPVFIMTKKDNEKANALKIVVLVKYFHQMVNFQLLLKM